MTKGILLSIRPEHVYNILNGDKTLELRKRVPKDFVGWVYVYVTKAIKDYKQSYYYQPKGKEEIFRLHGNIPLRFWFDEYEETSFDYIIHLDDINGFDEDDYDGCDIYGRPNPFDDNLMNDYLSKFQISYNDFMNYVGNKIAFAWHIKNLEIFDTPKQLSEFVYASDKVSANKPPLYGDLIDGKVKFIYELAKAPQSYQYVYVKE